MKNEKEKQDAPKRKKVWRYLYANKERKSVCGCPFGCLDKDSHNSIWGGRSEFEGKM